MSDKGLAADRLDAALQRLEAAVDAHLARAGDPERLRAEISLLIEDRMRLAHELDQALARERALQALADEASARLADAIAEVKSALEQTEPARGES